MKIMNTTSDMRSKKYVLQPGWHLMRLSDLCEPDRHIVEPNTKEADSLIYYSLEHIESGTGRILKAPLEQIEDVGKSTTYRFDENHVLYGKLRPYLNKVALPDMPGRCTTELIPLKPLGDIDRVFLAWVLRRPETVGFAMKGKTGSRMPRADIDNLLKLEIPIPPYDERKRLTSILNKQMAAVEKARDAAQVRLEAVTALSTATLRQVLPQPGQPLPSGSSWIDLGKACEITTGKLDSNAAVADGIYPFFTCSKEIFRINNYAFDCEAVLLSGNNASGDFNVKYYKGKFNAYQRTYVITIKSDYENEITYGILKYILETNLLNLKQKSIGQLTKYLKLGMITSIKLPLLTSTEQKRIEAILKNKMPTIEIAQKAAKEELDAINALPGALLRRAFNGEN